MKIFNFFQCTPLRMRNPVYWISPAIMHYVFAFSQHQQFSNSEH